MRGLVIPVLALCACARASGPPAVLVSPEELAVLERALEADVAANVARSCPRPVLRGASIPGPADGDIDALVRGTEDQAKSCIEAVEAGDEAVRRALDSRTAPEPPEIVEACRPAARMFRQAASHEDACSPYLAGRKGLPRLLRFLRLTKGLALVVRAEAEAGRVMEAAELLLDGLRVCQDLSRGRGAPMIADMVGVATARILVDSAGSAVLDRASRLSPDVLDRLVAEAGRLVDSEPAFSGLLPYERTGMALQMIQPKRKGPGWTPPGGFDEDSGPDAADPAPGADLQGVPRDQQLALAWLGMDRSIRQAEQACPDGVSALACLRGLKDLVRAVGDQTRVSVVSRVVQVALSPDPGDAWREQLLAILSGVATPNYPKWVLKHGERAFLLAAFRFRLAVLAFRAREGRCPGKTDLETGALRGFLVDPNTGTPMTIVSGGEAITGLAPSPEWTAESEEAENRVPIPVACGAGTSI